MNVAVGEDGGEQREKVLILCIFISAAKTKECGGRTDTALEQWPIVKRQRIHLRYTQLT